MSLRKLSPRNGKVDLKFVFRGPVQNFFLLDSPINKQLYKSVPKTQNQSRITLNQINICELFLK